MKRSKHPKAIAADKASSQNQSSKSQINTAQNPIIQTHTLIMGMFDERLPKRGEVRFIKASEDQIRQNTYQVHSQASNRPDNFNAYEIYGEKIVLLRKSYGEELAKREGLVSDKTFSIDQVRSEGEEHLATAEALNSANIAEADLWEEMTRYISELALHCAAVSFEVEWARDNQLPKSKVAELTEIAMDELYRLHILSLRIGDFNSAKRFMTGFLNNEFILTKHDADYKYAVIGYNMAKLMLYDVYMADRESIDKVQQSAFIDLVVLAKNAHFYFINEKNRMIESEVSSSKDGNTLSDIALMCAELAIFQAYYLDRCKQRIVVRNNNDNNIYNEIDVIQEEFKSNYELKNKEVVNDVSNYFFNKMKLIALLKSAIEMYGNVETNVPLISYKTQIGLLLELAIKLFKDMETVIFEHNIGFEEKRKYLEILRSNVEMINDAASCLKGEKSIQGQWRNCADNLARNYDKLIDQLDKEFVEKEKKSEAIMADIIRKEESEKKKKDSKKDKVISKKELQYHKVPEVEELGPTGKVPVSEQKKKDSLSIVKINAKEASIEYQKAFSLLIKKDFKGALQLIGQIDRSLTKKDLELKIKMKVTMAECHIAMAMREIKKKPLSSCFNKHIPVTYEARESVNNILHDVRRALRLCGNAKKLCFENRNSLSSDAWVLNLSNIEMVFLSAIRASKAIENERSRYLANMNQLKKMLIEKQILGFVVTDPLHLTKRGVEWCEGCEKNLDQLVGATKRGRITPEMIFVDDFTKVKLNENDRLEGELKAVKQNLNAMKPSPQEIEAEKAEIEKVRNLLIRLGNPYTLSASGNNIREAVVEETLNTNFKN